MRLVIILSIFLTGCTGIQSTSVESEYFKNNGVIYSLPTTRLPISIEINETAKTIAFTATQPIYVADVNHRYQIQSPYNGFYGETATLNINNEGLITTAKLVSDSRLTEIIEQAVKLPIFAENANAAATKKIIFKKSVDIEVLATNHEKLSELNASIHHSIKHYIAHQNSHGSKSFLTGHINKRVMQIKVEQLFDAPKSALVIKHNQPNKSSSVADCSIGVCYRIPMPYSVSATFFDGTYNETKFSVPNGSPVYAVAFNRGLFSDWTTNTTFVNGMISTYERTTTSEVEGIVSIPGQIIASQIAAIGQATSLLEKEKGLLDQQRALTEAKNAESALQRSTLFSFQNSSGVLKKSTSAQPQIGVSNNNNSDSGQTSTSNDGSG